eukprot:scaffold31557_cov91-Isochrysis_galbana.AAC.2
MSTDNPACMAIDCGEAHIAKTLFEYSYMFSVGVKGGFGFGGCEGGFRFGQGGVFESSGWGIFEGRVVEERFFSVRERGHRWEAREAVEAKMGSAEEEQAAGRAEGWSFSRAFGASRMRRLDGAAASPLSACTNSPILLLPNHF